MQYHNHNYKLCTYCGNRCAHLSEEYPGEYTYWCHRCYQLELEGNYDALYQLQIEYWKEQRELKDGTI